MSTDYFCVDVPLKHQSINQITFIIIIILILIISYYNLIISITLIKGVSFKVKICLLLCLLLNASISGPLLCVFVKSSKL